MDPLATERGAETDDSKGGRVNGVDTKTEYGDKVRNSVVDGRLGPMGLA